MKLNERDTGSRERYDVVVVGAGQAGLAMGYFLARQNKRFVIVDAADSIGAAWRSRWDSLLLFTPRRYDSLPGLDFPGDSDGYPTRDEVIACLEQYAEVRRHGVVLKQRAVGASGRTVSFADGSELDVDALIWATGYRPDYSWIGLPVLDERGRARHR